jgi:hypothetical protein
MDVVHGVVASTEFNLIIEAKSIEYIPVIIKIKCSGFSQTALKIKFSIPKNKI